MCCGYLAWSLGIVCLSTPHRNGFRETRTLKPIYYRNLSQPIATHRIPSGVAQQTRRVQPPRGWPGLIEGKHYNALHVRTHSYPIHKLPAPSLFFSLLPSKHSYHNMRLRRAARVILVGAPGVGKGTQSERLLHRFPQLSCISSGDLLRNNVKNRTALGQYFSMPISAHLHARTRDLLTRLIGRYTSREHPKSRWSRLRQPHPASDQQRAEQAGMARSTPGHDAELLGGRRRR